MSPLPPNRLQFRVARSITRLDTVQEYNSLYLTFSFEGRVYVISLLISLEGTISFQKQYFHFKLFTTKKYLALINVSLLSGFFTAGTSHQAVVYVFHSMAMYVDCEAGKSFNCFYSQFHVVLIFSHITQSYIFQQVFNHECSNVFKCVEFLVMVNQLVFRSCKTTVTSLILKFSSIQYHIFSLHHECKTVGVCLCGLCRGSLKKCLCFIFWEAARLHCHITQLYSSLSSFSPQMHGSVQATWTKP